MVSEKTSLITGKQQEAGPSIRKQSAPTNARMQWMADLVCAILSAEADRRPLSSSTVKRVSDT
jgi:hypothetical protein